MKTKRKCFFIYLQGRVFDGSKIATNFKPLKICVTLKYDYERTYHKSLTLKSSCYSLDGGVRLSVSHHQTCLGLLIAFVLTDSDSEYLKFRC